MKAKFEVRNCTGGLVETVEWDVADDIAEEYHRNDGDGLWSDWDLANEYTGRIFEAAGIKNYQCDGCYDSAYRVNFVGFIGEAGCNDSPVEEQGVLVVRIVGPKSQIGGVDDCGDLTDLISSISSGYFNGKITWTRE